MESRSCAAVIALKILPAKFSLKASKLARHRRQKYIKKISITSV